MALSEDEVISFCNKELAGFKAPKGVVFVDALPKDPSGELLKRELRMQWQRHYEGHVSSA
jgi:fatty-acyl-CoA synthase